MEVYTGAAITIVSETKCRKKSPESHPDKVNCTLKMYLGMLLQVVDESDVHVWYEQQMHDLILTMVTGDGPGLLGRNWLQQLRVNWEEIKAMTTHAVGNLDPFWSSIVRFFQWVESHQSYSTKSHMKAGEKLNFFKLRSLPYAIRGTVKRELECLE